jgi:hypothetical protein
MASIKCNHCGMGYFIDNNSQFSEFINLISFEVDKIFEIVNSLCPSCQRQNIEYFISYKNSIWGNTGFSNFIYPNCKRRGFDAEGVPEIYLKDYDEANSVLSISPAASAALSRRCLQLIIHEHFQISEKNLYLEINKLKSSNKISSVLLDAIDDLRHFGNFGAHPSFNSVGEIIQVETDEAEYCLEFLELLFHEVFILKKKREKTQQKLLDKRKDSGDKFIS